MTVETHLIAWIVAGLFSAAAVVVSVRLIKEHTAAFVCPDEQAKIIGILWMVPIYAMDSWLSLRFKDAAVYLDMARDCYEAYVIYLFFSLLVSYLAAGAPEGEEVVVRLLAKLPPMKHPFPFGACLPPIEMGASFLRSVKRSIMAFCALKPLLTVLACALQTAGCYDAGHFDLSKGYVYISLALNTSITVVFYWLVLFYLALRDEGRCAPAAV